MDYTDGKLDPLQKYQMYIWIGFPMTLERQYCEEKYNTLMAQIETNKCLYVNDLIGNRRVD